MVFFNVAVPEVNQTPFFSHGTKQTLKQTVTTGHESIAHLILHRESETSSRRVQVPPGLSEATAPTARPGAKRHEDR